MILENVRKAYYPSLPSRYQSIFASASIEEAKMFRQKFGCPEDRIYEVTATECTRVDMNYIYLGTQNIAGSFFAHQYWSGKATKYPFFEYVVKLPAAISKEVSI